MSYVQHTTLERYSISIGSAFGVTGVLLFVMQAAISEGELNLPPSEDLPTVDMVPRIEEPPIEEIIRQVPKPPPVEQIPPLPRPPISIGGGKAIGFALAEPKPDVGKISQGGGAAEGDLLPYLTIQPTYPQRALARGIEGWVIVEFVVDELGRVLEPRVIDAQPLKIFDREALKAVLRYKYKPRVVNGQPQMVNGVRQRIVFKLS